MRDWEWETDFAKYDAPVGCKHEWKGTWLIRTQVWDCTKCGAKKEEVKSEVQKR